MTDHIVFLVESDIIAGKEAELRSVVADLKRHVAATEPGTLRYDWYINPEAQTMRLVEEYDSMESAIFHGGNYATFRRQLDELRVVTKRTICGDLSDDAKTMLAPLQPEYFETL